MLSNDMTALILICMVILFMLFVMVPYEHRRAKRIKEQCREVEERHRRMFPEQYEKKSDDDWMDWSEQSLKDLGMTRHEIMEIRRGRKRRRDRLPRSNHW